MSGEGLEKMLALDDRAGPARRISDERAAAMVAAALGGVSGPPSGGKLGWIAGGAIVLGGVIGVATIMTFGGEEQRYEPAERVEATVHEEPGVEPRVVEPVEPPAPPSPAVARTKRRPALEAPAGRGPEDLLREANELRRARRWADAERAYREVSRSFPRSRAAQIAELSAAGLRLDQLGDPEGALALYERVGGGALEAQSLFGRARAYRRLGRTADERRALETIVARHAGTPLADAARRRLEGE